ncbi:MAG: PAS domain S-box protein, partial [Campylobacterales bacterium]
GRAVTGLTALEEHILARSAWGAIRSGFSSAATGLVGALGDHRELFENSATATLIYNKETLIVRVSRGFERLSGHMKDEVEGRKSWLEYLRGADRDKALKNHRRRFAGIGIVEDTYEINVIDKEGKTHYCRVITSLFQDGRYAMATLVDLTEKETQRYNLRRYSQQLELQMKEEIGKHQQSRQRLRLLFDSMVDAVFVYPFSGAGDSLFSDINNAACKLTGYGREALFGLSMEDICLFETPDRLALDQRLAESGKALTRATLMAANGERIPVEMSVSTGEIQREKTAVAVVRNITDRLEYERRREEQERLLIQQSKLAAMGEMVGNIAHQWRQPLNLLGVLLYNLRNDLRKSRLDLDAADGYYKQSRQLIEQMSKTIDDFRNFFKPSQKQTPFSVNEALRNGTELFTSSLKYNHISIEFDFEVAGEVSAFGHRSEFSQAFVNLLSNAKDVLLEKEDNDRRIKIGLSGPHSEYDGYYCVSVEDNGGGVEPSIFDRIFEPYFTTKEPGRGTGIGLYMTRLIMEKMGGRITVENGREGAIFYLWIPPVKPVRPAGGK